MKNYFFLFKRNTRGVSLVEVLVTLGIVAMLSSMLLASNRTTARRGELTRAAQILQADIRKAQSYAVSARPSVECDSSDQPVVFYGVQVATNSSNSDGSYTLFADCNTNNRYQSQSDEVLETIPMPQVYVSSLNPSGTLTVVYAPPNPTTRINNTNSSNFSVTLCHRRVTSMCILVRGNITGNVEIQ